MGCFPDIFIYLYECFGKVIVLEVGIVSWRNHSCLQKQKLFKVKFVCAYPDSIITDFQSVPCNICTKNVRIRWYSLPVPRGLHGVVFPTRKNFPFQPSPFLDTISLISKTVLGYDYLSICTRSISTWWRRHHTDQLACRTVRQELTALMGSAT